MSSQSQRPRYIRGTDAAIALLKTIGASDVPLRLTRLSESLGVPRASLYRIIRTLAEHGLLSLVRKGWVAPGPTWAAFAAKFEAICRSEDERSRRGDAHGTEGGRAGYGLLRNPDSSVITRGRFLHAPKFRIGFTNAALDNPWRTALVHAVEMGAARRADLVASLSVRHASRSIQRQIEDIEALASQGVEGLIISAVDCGALAPAIAAAASRGIPTVLVDRGDCALNRVASHVACDNWMIGHTMAHWLAERIGGRGGIVGAMARRAHWRQGWNRHAGWRRIS
jgi:ribose transport system substrate-binding protein